MKRVNKIIVVLIGIGLMMVGLSYAQPKIPKEEIPSNIPADVRKEIEKLYSSDPVERAYAAFHIGKGITITQSGRIIMQTELSVPAIPAIPFLISVLGDNTELKWRYNNLGLTGEESTTPGKEAAKALVKVGKPAIESLIAALKDENSYVQENAAWALKEITGQDFGQAPVKWQMWWKQNKETFLKGR